MMIVYSTATAEDSLAGRRPAGHSSRVRIERALRMHVEWSIALAVVLLLQLAVGTQVICISSLRTITNGYSFDSSFACEVRKRLGSGPRRKLLYIPTASYESISSGEQRRRLRYDAKQKMKIVASLFGFDESLLLELDARDISESKLRASIESSSLCYIDGGNTFVLQEAITNTRFFDLIADHIRDNKILYIGASAGAIVCNPTIATAFWKGWDNPKAANIDFSQAENCVGGALLPFHTFMHHENNWDNLINEKLRECSIDASALKLIPDDCALFYDDNNLELFFEK